MSLSSLPVKNKKNPIQQLVSSYTNGQNDESRLILIQHSASFKQRQLASHRQEDDSILYKRAQLRTPSQNAIRDATGGVLWFLKIVQEFSVFNTSVVWVQTLNSMAGIPESYRFVRASSNPLGWDDDDGVESNESVGLLNDLQALTCAIENAAKEDETNTADNDQNTSKIVVAIESLTPLYLRHGFVKILQWLHSLRNCILVVSSQRQSLTPRQQVALEDECSACLFVQDGQAILMRQGGRDRGNVMRNLIPYEITVEQNGTVSLELVQQENVPETEQSEQKEKPLVQQADASRSSGKKVVLQHQDDTEPSTTTATSTRPQIYIQDDDPEFDDLDEEDPDDDLDI